MTEKVAASSCESSETAPSAAPSQRQFIYALGRIEMRLPTLAVEHELRQAMGRDEASGKTDHEAAQLVLAARENRYLARQLCWVLTIQGVETYLLQPKDLTDFEALIATLRREPNPSDMDIVVGELGPISPPEMCNGLSVPIVFFDQIYSFDRDSLIKALPSAKARKGDEDLLHKTAGEFLDRVMQMAQNTGAGDEHRAYNYLVARYPALYHLIADAHARNLSLTAIASRFSPLSALRRIVEVIFSFTNRQTDFTEKYFVRVDVTEEFPFLVSKLMSYMDR